MASYLSDIENNATGICFLNYQQCVEHLNDESHEQRFVKIVDALIYPNIVFLSNDAKITIEMLKESLPILNQKYINYSISDILYYSEDKIEAINDYVVEHDLKRKYIVLDDDNLLADFPGQFFSTHEEALNTSIKQLRRIMGEGFWWSYEDRDIAENKYKYIDDDNYRSVIFLDVDGVLNEEDYSDKRKIHEERVERLAKIVHATEAEIVLSSSWRRGLISWLNYENQRHPNDSISLLLKFLGKYHMSISNITEDLESGHIARPLEIRTWLAERPNLLNFVILDDEDFWAWNWLSRFFVKTRIDIKEERHNKWIKGLTDANVQQAIEILSIVKSREDL